MSSMQSMKQQLRLNSQEHRFHSSVSLAKEKTIPCSKLSLRYSSVSVGDPFEDLCCFCLDRFDVNI